MSGDMISYRYTREELSALAATLGRGLVGLDLPALNETAYREAVDSLAAAGLVTETGDTLSVDRLTAVLLYEISGCERCDAFVSGGRVTLLWQGAHMWLMGAHGARGAVTLTPLQTADDAFEALGEALLRHKTPLTAAPRRPEGGRDVTLASRAEIDGYVRQLTDQERRVRVF